MNEAMTPTGRRILRQDYRGNEAYTVTRQDILAIEAEAFMDGSRASRENRLAIEAEAQRLTVERLHQYLHDEGVWPDDDEAWHLRVCEGALARKETGV
jgi:hypothetical protein